MRHLLLPLLRAVLRWEQFQLDQESCRLPGFVSWELRTDALQELWLTCNHQASLSHLGLPSTPPLHVPSWSCSWSLPREHLQPVAGPHPISTSKYNEYTRLWCRLKLDTLFPDHTYNGFLLHMLTAKALTVGRGNSTLLNFYHKTFQKLTHRWSILHWKANV